MANKQFLEGKYTHLRPLLVSDITDDYIGWLNDSEVCRYNSHHVFPYDKYKAEEYIKNISLSKDILVLAIIDKKKEKHIGNVSLQNIDLLNRSAEFAILIGDKTYWGKGISKEVSLLIIKHGFVELNLNRIYCGTSENNVGMIKLAKALNMKKEGVRRKAIYKNGNYHNIIEFGLLRGEYLKKYKISDH